MLWMEEESLTTQIKYNGQKRTREFWTIVTSVERSTLIESKKKNHKSNLRIKVDHIEVEYEFRERTMHGRT